MELMIPFLCQKATRSRTSESGIFKHRTWEIFWLQGNKEYVQAVARNNQPYNNTTTIRSYNEVGLKSYHEPSYYYQFSRQEPQCTPLIQMFIPGGARVNTSFLLSSISIRLLGPKTFTSRRHHFCSLPRPVTTLPSQVAR